MLRSLIFAAALLAPAVALPAFAGAQQTTPAPPPPARVTLLQAEQALSAAVFRSGYAKGMAGALSPDVVFLYEAAPVMVGRDDVGSLLDAQPALKGMRVHWVPIGVAVSGDGTYGMTFGSTVITETARGDSVPRSGSYISVWRRPPNGEWRLVSRVDAGLVDPASVVIPDAIRARPTARGDLLRKPAMDFAQADAAFARLAATSGAPAAFAQFAAADGATFGPGGTINIGPTNIRASLQASRSANASWIWTPLHGGGSGAGDLGFTVGEATIRLPNTPASDAFHSKYLTVWRRQADGTVRYLIDAGNSRPAR
jgi:ketosteroid isomerase-like protein